MSTDMDMTRGISNSDSVEDALQRVEDSFDAMMYHEGSAASEIAKILQLDKELGLTQDGDKVVLRPELAMSLPFEARIVAPQDLAVLDEKMRDALNEDDEDEPELTKAEEELTERLQHEWIDFSFDLTDPDSGESYPYHPIMQGKTLRIRVLREDELKNIKFSCATVRADGTLICVGKPQRTQF